MGTYAALLVFCSSSGQARRASWRRTHMVTRISAYGFLLKVIAYVDLCLYSMLHGGKDAPLLVAGPGYHALQTWKSQEGTTG